MEMTIAALAEYPAFPRERFETLGIALGSHILLRSSGIGPGGVRARGLELAVRAASGQVAQRVATR